ncbi:MAG: hypothetical protein OXE17_09020 [Chloroflexi bacterium]|nr:hypothetical protein [Chloroflexota bacterium]
MQQRTVTVDLPKQLLVEGRDEAEFFKEFLKYLHIELIQVQGYGGRHNLGNFLKNLVDVVGFDRVESIGVVQDADLSAQSALESVRGSLRNANLPVPQTYLVPSSGSPATFIFVMPNNSSRGALEDLCADAWSDDPAMHCVDQFIECLKNVNSSPPENRLGKAHAHAFLASRNEPDVRLGIAAQRDYIPWDHPALANLTQFLRDL